MSQQQSADKQKDSLIEELDIETLEDFIKSNKHEYKTAHAKLCFAIIARIYRRVRAGYRFEAIKVSEGEMVVDGNHRYIAYKLAQIKFEVTAGTRSPSDVLKTYNEISIDSEEDWDRNHKYTIKFCTDDFLLKEKFTKFDENEIHP